jgi:hypothetical protein
MRRELTWVDDALESLSARRLTSDPDEAVGAVKALKRAEDLSENTITGGLDRETQDAPRDTPELMMTHSLVTFSSSLSSLTQGAFGAKN